MKTLGLMLLLSPLLAMSAEQAQDESALTTTKDNRHYYNAKFELGVDKPENWYAQSVKEMLLLQSRGNALIAGDDKNMKAVIEASLNSSLPIFSFHEFPPGTPGKPNPNIIAVAENIAPYPGVKTGCDYLYHVKTMLGQSQVNMRFSETCESLTIDGSNFGYYDVSLTIGAQSVQQRYLACRQGEHAISIIQTYFDAATEFKLAEILKSLKLRCSS